MSTVFQNLMESKTDEELYDFQNVYKKYTRDALSSYLSEVKKRELRVESIAEIESWIENLDYEKFKDGLSVVSELNWKGPPNCNEIISSNQFLGIKLFTQTRCRRVVLKPKTFKSNTKFPALCLFNQKEFVKNLNIFKSDNEWEQMACELIMSTIYNLQSQNIITIHAVQDKYSYFSYLNGYKDELVVILKNAEKTKDILSDLIIKILDKKEKNEYLIFDFLHLITVFIDRIIGKKELDHPEMNFVINVLKLYSKSFDFIHLSNSKGILGIHRGYKLEINEKEKQVLHSQYVESGDLKMIDRGDSELGIFQFTRMRRDIVMEFSKRQVDFG